MCNKLAGRHVRVGLSDPSDVQRCDICENAPGMEIFSCICSSENMGLFNIWYQHMKFVNSLGTCMRV
ncbi:hypothetical protein SLEP1_g33757 [Rubroshorea leprosula]|uniref:Uncharacterized protein n=1 Tax=Rubroshorea leprosula TaxID=152421 RepID=A0AAV5KHV9_9ROSI|nr:hypothetical protein SLEP1_g33757 [Rubroshorea leprosula]